MDTAKTLTLKEVLEASHAPSGTAPDAPKLNEFFIDRPGKFDARSRTYVAAGWGVQQHHGMVYWRTECSGDLAGILECNFIAATPAGECSQGKRFLISYRG